MFKNRLSQKSTARRGAAPLSQGFRRNNPLQSSSSRQAHEQQALASQRQQQAGKRRQHRRRNLKLAGLAAGALLAGLSFQMALRSVQINSARSLSSQTSRQYQIFLENYVARHTLARQGWSLDKAQAAQALQRAYPEIKSTRFSQSFLKRALQAELEFRTPVYIWRDTSQSERYIDEDGLLFSVNRTSVKTADLIPVNDQSGIILKTGSQAVSRPVLALLGTLPAALKPLYGRTGQGTLSKVTIPRSTRELRVQPRGHAYYIKMSTERKAGEQAGELRNLLRFLRARKLTPRQYVDIRLPHKAFYK